MHGEVETIKSCLVEWRAHAAGAVGTVLIGDCNVHARRWLTYSNGETKEGDALRQMCEDVGALQMVRKPTRGPYLLDLAMTDMAGAEAVLEPGLSDHEMVQLKIDLSIPASVVVERKVYDYSRGDWEALQDTLLSTAWPSTSSQHATAMVQSVTDTILCAAEQHIPVRIHQEGKGILYKETCP